MGHIVGQIKRVEFGFLPARVGSLLQVGNVVGVNFLYQAGFLRYFWSFAGQRPYSL